MKKNLKRNNLLIVIIGCLCLIIGGYRVFRESNPSVISTISELNVPENIKELENDSEFIVKIKVSNKAEEFLEFDEDEILTHGYTLTDVKILGVISGDSSAIGDVITIYEPYYYKTSGVQTYLMTVEDYKPLTINNEYVLFLRNASNVGDNIYFMVANQYGKYIAKHLEQSDLTAKNIDVYQLDDHYIELYIDVMTKYIK